MRIASIVLTQMNKDYFINNYECYKIMSIAQRIMAVWNSTNGSLHTAPNIPLILNDNQYMAVIDDSTNFIRFMSVDGQIFLALNCPLGGDNFYICPKVNPILYSPTGGPNNSKDIFVLNNIIPLLI